MGLLFEEESYAIRGACFQVYGQMGCGFLEAVYQECLELEFRSAGIPFKAQAPIDIEYKGRALQQKYVPDFVCYDTIVVELKAVRELADEHRAQIQNYLRASSLNLGFLVNFGHHPKVQIERIVHERGRFSSPG